MVTPSAPSICIGLPSISSARRTCIAGLLLGVCVAEDCDTDYCIRPALLVPGIMSMINPQIKTFVLGEFLTNCFVVTVPGHGGCWIVDCGFEPEPLQYQTYVPPGHEAPTLTPSAPR